MKPFVHVALLFHPCLYLSLIAYSPTTTPQAQTVCADLEKGCEDVRRKFTGVLAYFGEDSGMTSTEFFTTLHKFVLVS